MHTVRVMLLMCAPRVAFREENINLTLHFHLIFLEPRTWAKTRRRVRLRMFLGHILPPSVRAKYYGPIPAQAAPVGEYAEYRNVS